MAISATVMGALGAVNNFDRLIKNLFANNEQGFAYDPNDLSTMFQDSAGTVPVTDVGQPVGLLLDKSKGLVLGDELFNAIWNTTSYPCTYTWSNSVLTVNEAAGSYAAMSTPFNTEIGAVYTIEVNVTSNNTRYWLLLSDDAVSDNTNRRTIISASSVGAKKYKYTFIATATQTHLHLNKGPNSVIATFTDITCKKISGNHATQATSASRPILRKNAVTGANYLEFDGSDDFLQTHNIDFTATDKMSLFAGVRKLRDTTAESILELGLVPYSDFGTFWFNANALTLGDIWIAIAQGGVNRTGFSKITPSANNYVFSAKLDFAGSVAADEIKPRLDGNQSGFTRGLSTSAGTGNFGSHPLYIGRRGGTSSPFNGHIYGLIGIGKLTSDSETIALEKVIAKNTGVTL